MDYLYILSGSTSVLFLSGPPRPVAIGTGADYVCSSENANIDISSIQWIINNMSLEDLNLPNVAATSFNGRALLFVNDLSMDFNETTVQCRANNSGTIINSNMIKLLVQGMPQAYACQLLILLALFRSTICHWFSQCHHTESLHYLPHLDTFLHPEHTEP